jgi:hypothetical protein
MLSILGVFKMFWLDRLVSPCISNLARQTRRFSKQSTRLEKGFEMVSYQNSISEIKSQEPVTSGK